MSNMSPSDPEFLTSMIRRHVKVDRSRKPQVVLNATGRKQFTDRQVVQGMPRGEGEEKDIVFFKIGRRISDDDLEKEYRLRGLRPADPYSLAKVNEDDPSFADTHPNETHWRDAGGKLCFAGFDRWDDRPCVYVDHFLSDWGVRWWFAGVCE